jgi:hypothetical protein
VIAATLCLLVFGMSAHWNPALASPPRAGTTMSAPISHEKVSFTERRRGVRIHLPLGPAYIYQDYPYYYSRGFYPTHIGGYVYSPYRHYYLGGYRVWDIRRSRATSKRR